MWANATVAGPVHAPGASVLAAVASMMFEAGHTAVAAGAGTLGFDNASALGRKYKEVARSNGKASGEVVVGSLAEPTRSADEAGAGHATAGGGGGVGGLVDGGLESTVGDDADAEADADADLTKAAANGSTGDGDGRSRVDGSLRARRLVLAASACSRAIMVVGVNRDELMSSSCKPVSRGRVVRTC
jgi:hypothetical protein